MSNSHTGIDRKNDTKHRQPDRDCTSHTKDPIHAHTEKSESKWVNADHSALGGPQQDMRRRGAIDLGREPRGNRPRRNDIDHGRPQIPDIEDSGAVEMALRMRQGGKENRPSKKRVEQSTGHTDRTPNNIGADENDDFVSDGLRRSKRLPLDRPTEKAQYVYYAPHGPRRGSKSGSAN